MKRFTIRDEREALNIPGSPFARRLAIARIDTGAMTRRRSWPYSALCTDREKDWRVTATRQVANDQIAVTTPGTAAIAPMLAARASNASPERLT